MQRVFACLLLFLLLVGCAQKQESSPKRVAMAFLSSVINDLGEHKIKYVDSRTRARLVALTDQAKARGVLLKPVEFLISVPQARDDWLGKKSVKVLQETETAAVVEIVSSGPHAPKITLNLVKESGKWVVSLLK